MPDDPPSGAGEQDRAVEQPAASAVEQRRALWRQSLLPLHREGVPVVVPCLRWPDGFVLTAMRIALAPAAEEGRIGVVLTAYWASDPSTALGARDQLPRRLDAALAELGAAAAVLGPVVSHAFVQERFYQRRCYWREGGGPG